jgi:C4-dicarboxylate-specific signal transduction histidine kinase
VFDWAYFAKSCQWLWEEPADELTAARLRAEQFSALARYTPGLMLANFCNALALLAAFWGTPRFVDALQWAATVFIVAGYIWFVRRRHSGQTRPARRRSTARVRALIYALALGSCWAALPLFFFEGATPGTQLLIACLSSGMLCGGAFALASIPLAALSFAGPIAAASFVALAHAGGKDNLLAAAVLLVYSAVLLRGVCAHAEQIKKRVFTEIETEERARQRESKLQASGLHAMGGMVSSLAHELNQPLSAASNYLSASLKLLQSDGGAVCEAALKNAAAEVLRAGEIVRRLRDFIMGGEPERKMLHLHALIEEARQSCRAAADQAGVELKLELDAEDDRILGDGVQIGQVLGNLIRNAIEAMEASAERVAILSTRAVGDGVIRVSVADTGPGVSPAIKDGLFAPFVTTKEGGMGVGLALSRSIIETHAGRIWAEPNPGGGACFNFTLPLARTDAGASLIAETNRR